MTAAASQAGDLELGVRLGERERRYVGLSEHVVCGAVAGAGTYAMGRAAIVYFLEGMTLTEARRLRASAGRDCVAVSS